MTQRQPAAKQQQARCGVASASGTASTLAAATGAQHMLAIPTLAGATASRYERSARGARVPPPRATDPRRGGHSSSNGGTNTPAKRARPHAGATHRHSDITTTTAPLRRNGLRWRDLSCHPFSTLPLGTFPGASCPLLRRAIGALVGPRAPPLRLVVARLLLLSASISACSRIPPTSQVMSPCAHALLACSPRTTARRRASGSTHLRPSDKRLKPPTAAPPSRFQLPAAVQRVRRSAASRAPKCHIYNTFTRAGDVDLRPFKNSKQRPSSRSLLRGRVKCTRRVAQSPTSVPRL